MPKLDPLLHQELRLSIVSYLSGVETADFKKLMDVTGATKGNLSVQISKLEKADYINVVKSFKGKYPHTNCTLTDNGRLALEGYISELKNMLNI